MVMRDSQWLPELPIAFGKQHVHSRAILLLIMAFSLGRKRGSISASLKKISMLDEKLTHDCFPRIKNAGHPFVLVLAAPIQG